MIYRTRNWKQLGYSLSVLLLAASCSQANLSRSKIPQSDTPTSETLAFQSPIEAASAQSENQLINSLQRGGYVIYFRHAATDYSQTDVREEQEWWKNCQTHRNLSQAGRSQADAIGTALRTLDIPIGQVLSSEYCRTVETAELMNIGPVQTTDRLNGARSWALSTEETEREQLVAATRQLLATSPGSGVNTVLISHTHNFENPAHPVLDEIAEGEAAIFQPDRNGAFTLVARISPEQWTAFAQ